MTARPLAVLAIPLMAGVGKIPAVNLSEISGFPRLVLLFLLLLPRLLRGGTVLVAGAPVVQNPSMPKMIAGPLPTLLGPTPDLFNSPAYLLGSFLKLFPLELQAIRERRIKFAGVDVVSRGERALNVLT